MFFHWFRKKQPTEPRPQSYDILAELEALTGAATRAQELPAWALLLRSPYRSYAKETSWLGGVPDAPGDFEWPAGRDGRPLTFMAQIDLAALKPEPSTASRAPGLPTEGALLVFIGQGYAIRVISAHDLKRAAPLPPPTALADVSELGFWGKSPTFTRWPVDPVAYLSRGEQRPDFLPDPFATPEQWITTWGLAALEASLAHDKLELELRLGREFMETHRMHAALGRLSPTQPHIQSRIAHCALMEHKAPKLLAMLHDWQAMAAAQPADAPVDATALSGIFTERAALSSAMTSNYGARQVLAGDAATAWQKIIADARRPSGNTDFTAIAPAYRSFVEAKVTDWRGHRLFGIEPGFPNNDEDLRHQNPMISIAADALIGSELEHHYGVSVWFRDDNIAIGRHADGQLIWHCAV